MSWLTDLAGRAEDILNKIDQNAANVLQIQSNEINVEGSPLSEIKKSEENILNRSSSPLKLRNIKSELSISSINESNRSSRRNSLNSSKYDGTGTGGTVIEKDLNTTNEPIQSTTIEQELAALKIVLVEVKSERDELKSEIEDLMDQLKQATNQTRVIELEDFCIKIESERDELLEKNYTLENSNLKYIKSISELETAISKIQQHELELQQKIEFLQQEKEQANTELQQYRSRAQASLLAKEKVIDELKKGLGNQTNNKKLDELIQNSESPQSSINQNIIENENLKKEILLLKDELEILKQLNLSLEEKNRDKIWQYEEKYEKLLESFKLEQKRNRLLDDEIKSLNLEIKSVREEIVSLRNTMSKKLYDKENEISKLKSKISQQSENNMTCGIEDRLHSLTQSLVQKQTALESLTAERNALRLQLEKTETQHRSTIMKIRQQKSQIVNMNDTDDAKAQVPAFLQENPFDTTVARRVKRAYSSLDSISICLGVFLRRFPLIRIFVILYIAILHLWVLIVLLSSTPN